MESKMQKEDLKILHINTENGYRGGEIQTLELMKYLKKKGISQVLLCHNESPLKEKALKENIEVLTFKPLNEFDIFSALKIRKIIKDKKINLTHCHTAEALGLSYLGRVKNLNCKIVATRRVSFQLKRKFSLRKYEYASKIVCVSQSIADTLINDGLSKDKVMTIHSGFDLKKFSNLPEPQIIKERLGVQNFYPVIGVVGAFVHHKGHKNLIKALCNVWIYHKKMVVLFVGDGPAKDDILSYCSSKALPHIYLGYVENIAPIYKAFDIFVLPSISGEGSPAVVKEAAASMVPVVSTDVGGIKEILRNGKEAILVPPNNPSLLAEAIMLILNDKEYRDLLVKEAYERVKIFDFEIITDAYLKLYLDLFNL